MSYTARIYQLNQSILCACPESSPARGETKAFSDFGPTCSSERRHSQLHQLKRQLLRAALEETHETAAFKPLCAAANQAAVLAWTTAVPLLVFPCLFEEMLETVRARFRQEQIQKLPTPPYNSTATLPYPQLSLSITRADDHD